MSSKVRRGFDDRAVKAVTAVLAAALVWAVSAVAQPAGSGGAAAPAAPATTKAVEALYARARGDYEAGRHTAYAEVARDIIAHGDAAVAFLVATLDGQAERVSSAEDVQASGIRVTINLLGRMNSYRDARTALHKLGAHPVAEVGKWAKYAMARKPQTRPSGVPLTTTQASQPTSRRVVGGRIVTEDGWFRAPAVKRPELGEKITNVFVIPIREPITTKTYDAIKRKVAEYKATADLLVLDMDTWGGEAIAALDIARLLKTDLANVYTVCYARTRAISAGALIAVACDEIIMTPVGKLGDCAPLVQGMAMSEVLREKIESPLRTEFAESAEQNGYSVALAESMVTIGHEVWLIRNDATGELRYVKKSDRIGRVRIPRGVSTAPSDDSSQWELLRVEVPAGKLLTMRPQRALEYGFASRLIDAPSERPLSGLMKHYNVTAEPTVLVDNWSERLVEFLMHPAVLGFLMFLGVLCAYVEVHTPGFGVAGAVAIICFGILFGSRYLTGLAQWWEIGVFVVGVALLLAEVFITPGFGVLGIAGLLCCVVALLAMAVPNPADKLPVPETPLDWSMLSNGALALALGFFVALGAAGLIARFLPELPVAGRLLLAPPPPAETPPASEGAGILAVRPGQSGEVVQTCRPVGKVRVGGELVDAIADGAFIDAGTRVVVLRNEGNRIVVEAKT